MCHFSQLDGPVRLPFCDPKIVQRFKKLLSYFCLRTILTSLDFSNYVHMLLKIQSTILNEYSFETTKSSNKANDSALSLINDLLSLFKCKQKQTVLSKTQTKTFVIFDRSAIRTRLLICRHF